MIHLGDITKISGADAPVVDVIIGGSPCQDLSVAGKRAGLAGERSGLYMEQLRVIKEMRHKDELGGRTGQFVRPRYMVWENVPGAFSCNHGADFSAVLTEAVRVIEPEAPDVPVPEKGWPTAGVLLGDEWSIAWRVLDAQYWGVPQRRRRIALVCDFGGQSAPKILFVSNSVSGHPEESRAEGKGAAGSSGEGTAYTMQIRCGCPGGGKGALIQTEKSACLSTSNIQTLFQPKAFSKGTRPHGKDEAQKWFPSETANALNTFDTGEARTNEIVVDSEPIVIASSAANAEISESGVCPTMLARAGTGGNMMPIVAGINFRAGTESADVNGTLQAKATGGWNVNDNNAIRDGMTVRRLTPLECERLQGYPDGWTDIGEWVDSKGKKHKDADSPRYKSLGNSIALPPWRWVLKRLCSQYERTATMASLFDGIGGFPLIWEGINGKGSCLWASEIEEFPMAVTKIRFGGNL